MQYLKSKIFDGVGGAFGVRHAFTMRQGGVSKGPFASLNLGLTTEDSKKNVIKNYEIFCKELGVDIEKLVLAYQQHTDKVVVVERSDSGGGGDTDDGRIDGDGIGAGISIGQGPPGQTFGPPLYHWPFYKVFNNTDGFITNQPGLALVVRFADCQGVLMFDPVKKVIAALHCGWRGSAQNIIGKAVEKMVANFDVDPKNILVAISPSLGPCCARFTDPHEELSEFMHKYICGETSSNAMENRCVDLWQCSIDQLTASGVKAHNIDILRRCTVCENDKFFSSRASGGKTGHMAGVIWIENNKMSVCARPNRKILRKFSECLTFECFN